MEKTLQKDFFNDLSRKTFVVDTSVLLYDKNSIFNMTGNNIVIPLVVLEEIDKFKTREGLLGEYARFFNRFLDELREKGSLHDGVYYEEADILIQVKSKACWDGLEGLEKNYNDNVIIATANKIKSYLSEDQKIKIITKDINLRVKCDAVGIEAGDYYADYKFIQEDNLYSGAKEVITEAGVINNVYGNGYTRINREEMISAEISQNEFVVLKTEEGQSCLTRRIDNNLAVLETKQELYRLSGIEAKNKEQVFALELLLDDTVPLVTLTGIPGSGKTFLTLMVALRQIEKEKKKRIIFTRPIQTVGKDLGFLPGTLNEKMHPWILPIVDNFRNQFGDLTYFEMMMERGQIDVAPLSHIRGRSFNDSIIIVDEAQNATVHELKTVITRTGKNSKIVLLGDIDQVDLPYVNKFSNGLTIVIEKLKEEKLTGHVNFTKGYRSELANIVAEKL